MTLTQVWGAFLLFTLCPLLGGLPLIAWITRSFTGQDLRQMGTGNISVSAAFYHGGRWAGMLAVLSEALKGIAAVLLARYFFPSDRVWELVALIALVMGRYWFGKGAGTTNVVWGYIVHDPIVAGLTFLIGGVSFTILREKRQGQFGVLILFPLLTALLHPRQQSLIVASITLAVLIGWIYTKVPADLNLPSEGAEAGSRSVFRFFRGDRAIPSLGSRLDAHKVGQKAATLSHLKRLGYPVPPGWVLVPGDDPEPLLEYLQPSPRKPLVVRSSAVGEDSETASAAGQYETVLSVTRSEQLAPAISRCLASYDDPRAVTYRRDRGLPDASMAVLIQQQVRGVFSGVAFSRDPITRQGEAVVIDALPGDASQVVSGQVTPESYGVIVPESADLSFTGRSANWQLSEDQTFAVQGEGDVPPRLIQQVAFLARHLESYYQGVPQDVEWSYDGQALWLLQSRPITTLLPIWTRKIAAEVIPGAIHPLTWSINRPLTCGVWGDIFTIVLANRARDLDFNETATLHYSHAYFNATLLGQIFRRMGLPAESLEFLTRGAKFRKPPLRSTLQNTPGLLRLLSRERSLLKDFQRDHQIQFAPALAELSSHPPTSLTAPELLMRVDRILDLLKVATYYSILAPLSAALRKAISRVPEEQLDNSDTPEVRVVRSLQELAGKANQVLQRGYGGVEKEQLFTALEASPDGQAILRQFDQLVDDYGYLSETGTDIAVPTWKEDPRPLRDLFVQFCLNPLPVQPLPRYRRNQVQQRLTLKGRVTEVYTRLLAELRWTFVALEQQWREAGYLGETGDIFFLKLEEIRRQVAQKGDWRSLQPLISQRRTRFEQDREREAIPYLVYGNDPPEPVLYSTNQSVAQKFQGIGASPGLVEGEVQIIRNLSNIPPLNRSMILVVPYTDSGWAPLLAQAGGLIAEVGGRLSHGAIVAREYQIPAVMNVQNATRLLQNGQRVRIDGRQGLVEVLIN
jgi:pyruvate,water dikinase